MRLFTHAESGQVTYTPLSLDITKHSRYILSTMLYTQKKNIPAPPSPLLLSAFHHPPFLPPPIRLSSPSSSSSASSSSSSSASSSSSSSSSSPSPSSSSSSASASASASAPSFERSLGLAPLRTLSSSPPG